MPTVLIVSRYFPPLSSAGGSIRLVKFIKYLSTSGWNFVVFTQDINQTVVFEQTLSGFLFEELPKDVLIRRIAAPFSPNGLAPAILTRILRKILGESSLAWGARVFWNGWNYLRSTKVDLIFSVTPPFTNALVAMLLGWFGRIPHVLDLKDDWVGSPSFLQKRAIQQALEKVLEASIVRHAKAVVTVTPESFYLYNKRYAHLGAPEKIHLIPNGCDLEEYQALQHRERTIISRRFLILSAAWGFRKDYRDIRPFLFGLHRFFGRCPEAQDKIDVVLLGDSLSSEYAELLTELKIDRVIQSMGAVKRGKLIEWLWKADLFLLVQPVGNTTAVSGTLYEYWTTGKAPILLISEKGASSTLVEDNKLGQHFSFDEIDGISLYIEKIYDAYQSGRPHWIERNGVENYDRKLLAGRMESIWKRVAGL